MLFELLSRQDCVIVHLHLEAHHEILVAGCSPALVLDAGMLEMMVSGKSTLYLLFWLLLSYRSLAAPTVVALAEAEAEATLRWAVIVQEVDGLLVFSPFG